MTKTFETSLNTLKAGLKLDFETKTKEMEKENETKLKQLKEKYEAMNACIPQMTLKQLKSEDSFSVPLANPLETTNATDNTTDSNVASSNEAKEETSEKESKGD